MKKRVVAMALLTTVVMGMAGCASTPSSSEGTEQGSTAEQSDGEDKLVIGMAMNEEIDFVNGLQNALQAKADEAGDIEMIFTNANGDAEKQLSDVDSLIAQQPDVIVLRTVDADAGVACVEAVKNAGILCVVQDTPVNTDLYDCRIVGDQTMVGELIGEYMQAWLDEDDSRMIHMGYINGGTSETIQGREMGIYNTVDPDRIDTFSSQVAQGFSAEDAMSYAEDWLQSQPDMNCIACANDEMAAACIQALNAAGVNPDDFLVFGCDGGAIGQQYLESGELDATVSQSVTKVADAILEVSRGLAAGETYEGKAYDPQCFELMTKDNMEQILSEE